MPPPAFPPRGGPAATDRHAHCGPCGDGDWYARRLYLNHQPGDKKLKGLPDYDPQSQPDHAYLLHRQRYGHPSPFAYKDILPSWRAEKWEPDKLMDLYVAADDTGWLMKNTSPHEHWRQRITDRVDRYHPDLIYSDCALPFLDSNDVGLAPQPR